MSFLRDYLCAVRASTRVPVTGALGHWLAEDEPAAPTSNAQMPGVGWLVGVVACASFAVIGLMLPAHAFSGFVAAVGSTMATLLLTGGVHERGLARAAERAAALGALALQLVMLAKLALLALLAVRSPGAVLAALLCGHVVSRFWPLFLGARVSRYTMMVAAAWSVAALAVGVLALGWAGILVGLVLSAAAWWGARKGLAGNSSTPDDAAVGTTQQLCEIAFLLGAAIGAGAR